MQLQEVSYETSCCHSCARRASFRTGGPPSLSSAYHLPRAHPAHARSAPRPPSRRHFSGHPPCARPMAQSPPRLTALRTRRLFAHARTRASRHHALEQFAALAVLERQPIADWLWQQADTRIQALSAEGEQPLLVWDGSVLEKPETITNPDLCALRSSKARRLKRIRPGFSTHQVGVQSVFLACTGWGC